MYQVSKSAQSGLFQECWYNLITRLVNEEGIFISFIMLALPYPLRISVYVVGAVGATRCFMTRLSRKKAVVSPLAKKVQKKENL